MYLRGVFINVYKTIEPRSITVLQLFRTNFSDLISFRRLVKEFQDKETLTGTKERFKLSNQSNLHFPTKCLIQLIDRVWFKQIHESPWLFDPIQIGFTSPAVLERTDCSLRKRR